MFQTILGKTKGQVYKRLNKTGLNNNATVMHFFKEAYRIIEYAFLYVRCQKPIVKLLGYSYTPSKKRIEIDITYRCNLACPNCNRSLGNNQAKSKEGLSLEQIERFVAESKENGFMWEIIRVLGGEPTMHPRFFDILKLLGDYKREYSPKTCIEVWTNGCGERVRSILANIPDDFVIIDSSKKQGETPLFNSFNLAPIDSSLYKLADFSNGCSVIRKCGVGLTPYGYYPCAIAGSIDRVFGFNIGEKKLSSSYHGMRNQLDTLCRHCGHFRASLSSREERKSASWEVAYMEYKKKKPEMDLY